MLTSLERDRAVGQVKLWWTPLAKLHGMLLVCNLINEQDISGKSSHLYDSLKQNSEFCVIGEIWIMEMCES